MTRAGLIRDYGLVNLVGLLVIGFGIGVFLSIAVLTWSTTPITLCISLVAISISALFVGAFSFGKNYQSNSKKDDTTNKNLSMLIPNDAKLPDILTIAIISRYQPRFIGTDSDGFSNNLPVLDFYRY